MSKALVRGLLAVAGVCAVATVSSQPVLRGEDVGAVRETGFEVVARLDKQPEHVVVLPDGRIICSLSEIDSPDMALAEVKDDGVLVPYPSKEAAGPRTAAGVGFVNIVTLASDGKGLIGAIDIGDTQHQGQIVVIDTKANAIQRTIPLPARRNDFRFVQDLVVDPQRRCIYLAGHNRAGKTGALICYDLGNNAIRVFPITNPKWAQIPGGGGRPEVPTLTTSTVESIVKGVNLPLALDPQGTWLYFAGLAGTSIFCVPAADLADPAMTPEVLATKITEYGEKPVGASMVADNLGRVFVTDENAPGIGMFWKDRGYRTIAKDSKAYWPYGLTMGPNGDYLYITVNRLRAAAIVGDISRAPREPYVIARTKVPAPETGQ